MQFAVLKIAYRANQNAAFWLPVKQELYDAKQNKSEYVTIYNVEAFPHPDYMYFKVFDPGRYEERIRVYYDIPITTRLQWLDKSE